MSSSTSSLSCGWEEVNISEWEDDSWTSETSWDSERIEKVNNSIGVSTTAGNQEEEIEKNSSLFEMADKTNKRGTFTQNIISKAHALSESEDSSSEPLTPSVLNRKSVNSSMSLNETASTTIIPSSSRNFVNDQLSPSDSNESDCESKETNSNNLKVLTDISKKTIALQEQNNGILNNEDYIPFKLEGELSVENIGDEEIWMVQCPLDLDPAKLVNKEFDFAGISEFAIETENTEKVYTATACTGRWKSLSCLLPSSERKQLEAVVVNAAGQIIITEKVLNSQLNSTVPARSNKMEFPQSLKVRHPLFGADYEKELDIRRQRLSFSSLEKKKKKKKKISKDISYETVSENQTDDWTHSISEDMKPQMDFSVISKKAKKRRHSESFNANAYHSDKDDTGKLEGKHLKKRFKKSPSSNSIDESMEIDSHINQEYSKKKKKKKKKHAVE